MEKTELKTILKAYYLSLDDYNLSKLGHGHIHQTLLVEPLNAIKDAQKYVLQQLNTKVFNSPLHLIENHQFAASFLKQHAPNYYFLPYLSNRNGELLTTFKSAQSELQYWRLMPFLEGEVYETVAHLQQAYQAAKAFANFSAMMAKANKNRFHTVLPGFHDADFRWRQLLEAKKIADSLQLSKAAVAIRQIKKQYWIVEKAVQLEQLLPRRIQHMDAKISNVIFTKSADKSVVLLDLDTIMPANILSDVGDMVRTMAANVSENEPDYTKAYIRKDIFEAIEAAYLEEMKGEITVLEIASFKFAVQKMIYLQAVRFLSDFLIGNRYYPVAHEDQNLHRCLNQLNLLDSLNKF